jgi:PAS domain S-box-containing protein
MQNPDLNPGNSEEIEILRQRLAEAEDALSAIRRGEIDALVVNTPRGDQIFTLRNAERPYRIMVEQMSEGAFTISHEGIILYGNPSFAQMVKLTPDKILLASIYDYIAPESRAKFENILKQNERGEIITVAADGTRVRTFIALRSLTLDENMDVHCAVVTDLTEHKQTEDLERKIRESREKERRSGNKGRKVSSKPENLEELRQRMEEAEQTLAAIRNGEVDALVVDSDEGDQVFTLKSPERHYRIIVEQMNAGALTLSTEGHILYCNQRFAQIVKAPLQQILGTSIYNYLAPESQARYRILVEQDARGEISLVARDKTSVPAYFVLNTLTLEDNLVVHAAIVANLTKEK